MKRLGFVIAVLMSTLWASSAVRADSEAAWAELASLSEGREEITTYVADFRQEKLTPLLRDPIESAGRVRIAEGVSRWDTDPPYASTMLIADGELKLHYPEQRSLEIYELGDRLDAVAASPVPDFEVLRANFEIASSGWTQGNALYTLTLLPKSEAMQEAIEEVAVDIDATLGSMRRLSMTDLDGETTTLFFENVQLNVSIDPAELELKLPEGTDVIRPLKGVDR